MFQIVSILPDIGLMRKVQVQTPMCLYNVSLYLKDKGVLPYIFQNDKFSTSETIKFTKKDSKLTSASLEYTVSLGEKSTFYLGFGRSFENGVMIESKMTGKCELLVSKCDTKEFENYITSNTRFIVQVSILDVTEPCSISMSFTLGSNGKIHFNGKDQ